MSGTNGKIRWPIVLFCVVLAACVKPPPTTTPEIGLEVPGEWAALEDDQRPREPTVNRAQTGWWEEFEDPQLSALIELALERNTELVAAAARVDRAAAEARIAGADLEPSLGLRFDPRRQRFNPATFGNPQDPLTFSTFGLSLDVAWEVDLWGRLRATTRAALAQAQATDADHAGARLSIAGQTAKTWFAVQEALQQIELARSSADSFRTSAEQIRVRYEMGIRPPVDLRLALSNLAGAEALLELRRQQLARSVRQLEILLARYPDGSLLEQFPSAGLPELPPPAPAGLPAEVVSRRPDLMAAERRLVASDQRLKAARRALYPRLSLTGSAGTLAIELADLIDGDFGVWSLAASLTQPLFQGGRLRAGVSQAAAGNEETLALYVGAVLRAFAEVESALAVEEYLKQQVLHLEEAAKQTIAAQTLSEDRYREGLGGYLVVLESQTRALTAQSELFTARRNLLDNRVDLHLALGGGFELPDPPADASTRADTTTVVAEDVRDE